jgi:hypothetical protein
MFWHILLGKYLGDFPAPVGTEIKTYHYIAWLDASVAILAYHGFEKLIRNALRITFSDGGREIDYGFALIVHQQVVG